MKTESFTTLEVGRKYLSRRGVVDKIKSKDEKLIYPFEGQSGTVYKANGNRWASGTKSYRDLIRRIVEPTTLTIQRWGVVWRSKKCLLINTVNTANTGLPYTFATRREARQFSKEGFNFLKPVKVKCTYEVIE